jgi:hypothetical protein
MTKMPRLSAETAAKSRRSVIAASGVAGIDYKDDVASGLEERS